MVETGTRLGDFAGDGADIDDAAPARAAHSRQYQLAHTDEAENIDLELPPHGIHGHLFDRPVLPVSRIVHQYIEASVSALDGFYGILHRSFVGHVELNRVAALRFQLLYIGDPARGRDGHESGRLKSQGGRPPDARGRAGYQGDGLIFRGGIDWCIGHDAFLLANPKQQKVSRLDRIDLRASLGFRRNLRRDGRTVVVVNRSTAPQASTGSHTENSLPFPGPSL